VRVKNAREHNPHKDRRNENYGRGDCGTFIGGVKCGNNYAGSEEYQTEDGSGYFEGWAIAEKFGKAPDEKGGYECSRNAQGKNSIVNNSLYGRWLRGWGLGAGGAKYDDSDAEGKEQRFEQSKEFTF
jgi:hypothetical protein